MKTSVLFIIFNRPELTRKVFNQIMLAKPPKLYIAADGPRISVLSDIKLCKETRSIVNEVDWNCEIFTLFNESNKGIRYGVANAIDWFFSNENEGIILEDDCVADLSFFPYCEELLEKYRNVDEVALISGTNLHGKNEKINESYFFSGFPRIWGWASWRRAWAKYDVEMKDWPKYNKYKWLPDKEDFHEDMLFMWENIFDNTYYKKTNSWDHIWFYTIYKNKCLSIIPQTNLIKNIGFGPNATHTINKVEIDDNNYLGRLHFPLKHPEIISRDRVFDNWIDSNYYYSRISYIRRILRRIPYLKRFWEAVK